MKQLQAPVVGKIEKYLAAADISEGYFGRLAVKDRTFVERLREGRVTYRVAQQALMYIREHPVRTRRARAA